MRSSFFSLFFSNRKESKKVKWNKRRTIARKYPPPSDRVKKMRARFTVRKGRRRRRPFRFFCGTAREKKSQIIARKCRRRRLHPLLEFSGKSKGLPLVVHRSNLPPKTKKDLERTNESAACQTPRKSFPFFFFFGKKNSRIRLVHNKIRDIVVVDGDLRCLRWF